MKTSLKCLGRERTFLASLLLTFILGLAAANASIQPISLPGVASSSPAGGDGNSVLPVISADGRYVLFASTANNLVLTNNNNAVLPQRMNVFLRDRISGKTTLVSANLAGVGGGNDDSFPAGISSNGRFALFESAAANLVPNDTNGADDIFLRNMASGVTTLVSVSTTGAGANGASYDSVLTPDGRYVAFTSAASNLVAGDTNGIPDVFVRDLQADTTALVSVGAKATNSASPFTCASELPSITPDGRYVAFYSTATNLVSGIGTSGEVYVRDLQDATTIWASTNGRALFQSVTGSGNAACCNVGTSDDGRFVAYEVCTNSPSGSPASGIILRYNLQTGSTDIINTNAHVADVPPDNMGDWAMTPDGRFVAFVGNVGNNTGTNTAVYLWDAQSGSNTLVGADFSNPAMAANGLSDSPAISSNGQWVAFISSATDLTTNTSTEDYHVYLRDMQTGTTQLLDADTNGSGAGVNPMITPALTGDGSAVAFESANMLNNNRHLVYDVFAFVIASNSTELVSAHDPVLPSLSPNGISGLTAFSASSNGQFIAFESDADNLVSGDTNETHDVFVRDLGGATNILTSVNTNGVVGDGISTDPAIGGDGRYVVFTSSADDLVPGDNNNDQDVFIRDLQLGTTILVSVSTNGVDPGNGDSYLPAIGTGGNDVLFHSRASNLAPGVAASTENLFLRDLQSDTTYTLTSGGVYGASMTPDGHRVAFIGTAPGTSGAALYVWDLQSAGLIYTNAASSYSSSVFPMVSISPDGQKVAFVTGSPLGLSVADLSADTVMTLNTNGTFASHVGLQFSRDGRFLTYAAQIPPGGTQNVYRYDSQTGTNQLISQDFNSQIAANGDSDSPVLSGDGHLVAFRSSAGDIVPNDSNGVPDLFIYDLSNNAAILVSVSASGSSTADDRSLNPVFSADGRTLFFQSWGSDLSTNDFNNGSDIYALDLTALPITGSGGSTNSGSAFYAQFLPAGSFSSKPTISWPLASGNTYEVQYKNDLSDSAWQDLPANITFVGNTGYVSDPSPPQDRRFYRVLLNP